MALRKSAVHPAVTLVPVQSVFFAPNKLMLLGNPKQTVGTERVKASLVGISRCQFRALVPASVVRNFILELPLSKISPTNDASVA